ncbi:hypothetical protein GCM10007853_19680 [Algimonas ampicilliniresistens]|uniref:Uncharacterized protein n=1 Tax=Algimonas ampicilliniresistens TaxID=1298735 RepID=A0ABQ5V996_9PROT|nr:hypothetical protein GCM10007853_19680 [Algimonas ampicilliniresistens]
MGGSGRTSDNANTDDNELHPNDRRSGAPWSADNDTFDSASARAVIQSRAGTLAKCDGKADGACSACSKPSAKPNPNAISGSGSGSGPSSITDPNANTRANPNNTAGINRCAVTNIYVWCARLRSTGPNNIAHLSKFKSVDSGVK